jgi:type III secretion protein T
METLDLSAAQILAFAVSLTRLATAFLVIPALAPETVPPLVRNSLFVSLGLVLLAVQPDTLAIRPDVVGWIALFAR